MPNGCFHNVPNDNVKMATGGDEPTDELSPDFAAPLGFTAAL